MSQFPDSSTNPVGKGTTKGAQGKDGSIAYLITKTEFFDKDFELGAETYVGLTEIVAVISLLFRPPGLHLSKWRQAISKEFLTLLLVTSQKYPSRRLKHRPMQERELVTEVGNPISMMHRLEILRRQSSLFLKFGGSCSIWYFPRYVSEYLSGLFNDRSRG